MGIDEFLGLGLLLSLIRRVLFLVGGGGGRFAIDAMCWGLNIVGYRLAVGWILSILCATLVLFKRRSSNICLRNSFRIST